MPFSNLTPGSIPEQNCNSKIYVYPCVHRNTLSCSVVSGSLTPWTVTCQAPLSVGFPRQEYWSGLTFILFSREPSWPGIKTASPVMAGRFFFYHWASWEALKTSLATPANNLWRNSFVGLLFLFTLTLECVLIRSVVSDSLQPHGL